MGPPAMKIFCESLKENKKLESLKISCHDPEIDLKNVCDSLTQRSFQNLTYLNLKRSQLNEISMKFLCQFLNKNSSLTVLKLPLSYINDDSLKVFCDSSNVTLKVLNLKLNSFSNLGLTYLCKYLNCNTSLHYLDISKNSYNDQGFYFLYFLFFNIFLFFFLFFFNYFFIFFFFFKLFFFSFFFFFF